MRCGHIAWFFEEDYVKEGCEVHFQALEGVICRFGHRFGLQYDLSSVDRWIDKRDQHDIRGNVQDVCDASTMKVGRVPSIGRVHIKQRVSRIL